MSHETALQDEIRLALGDEIRLALWPNRVVKLMQYNEKTGKPFWLLGGLPPGSPDLVGVLNGRFFALEVKRPGNHAEPHQEAFLAMIRLNGGFACVVHSIEEARAAVIRAREGALQ